MAGLLDALNSDNGMLGLYLMAAGSAKPQRTSLGEGLLGGLQMVQQQQARRKAEQIAEEERKQRGLLQSLQMQQIQQGMSAQQQAAQERAAAQAAAQAAASRRGGFLDSINPNSGPAMPFNPAAGLQAGLRPEELKLLAPTDKPAGNVTLKPGEQVFSPDGKPLFGLPAAPKEQAPDEFERALRLAGVDPASPIGRQMALDRARKMATHQPGTQVSVNTGQKGLDNTLKLRGDFRSEPVYKAHQEMQSAYSQIQQALKQASPAGDLAGATKIMKLLDPGSVVRESELGMAMAASGLMDRVQNYASNIMAGTKLTPTQRADFQRLADALYSESVKQYNGKRGEYQGIAERNGLSVPDVLGSESQAPTSKVVNFGDLK